MNDKTSTENDRVLAAIRAGQQKFRDIRAHAQLEQRAADRALQRLRKAGTIKYEHGYWLPS